MTYEQLKAAVDAWVEKYVKQTVDFPTGKAVTEARLEELFNLLIIQGDNSAQGVGYIRDFLTAYMQEMQITVTDNVDDAIANATAATTAANTAAANTNAVITAANQAISDTNAAAQNAADAARDLEDTYAPRLTTLEGVNADARLDTLEAINADSRLDTIENEMDVLEATLSQDYKSIFSSGIGKDSTLADQDFSDKVEGQSDVKIEGLTDNNVVKDGDFPNTTNWAINNSTISALNNVLIVTADGTAVTGGTAQTTKMPIASGKKVYIRGSLRVTNANCALMKFYAYGSVTTGTTQTVGTINAPVQNQWYDWSAIITIPADAAGNLIVKAIHQYVDLATANGKVMEMKNVMAKDIAALGLDSLTLAQLNFMADHYINGLQGVGSHKIVSVGKNLFDDKKALTLSNASIIYNVNGFKLKSTSAIAYSLGYVVYRLKPNTTYVLSAKSNRISGTSSMTVGDISAHIISEQLLGHPTPQVRFTVPSDGYVRLYFYDTSSIAENGEVEFADIQLEEGTVATSYEPYQSSELNVTLPRQLHRVPNGVVDTVEEVNEVAQVAYRNNPYTLVSSDIASLDTTLTTVDFVRIKKNTDYAYYNQLTTNANKSYIIQNMPEDTSILTATLDSASNIGKSSTSVNATYFIYFVAKGTYPTLADAQAALTNTKIIYQTTVPTVYKNGENGFSVTGNLEVFKGGTIYIEPTTLKECTNPKTYVTYNLSKQAVVMGNSGELTEIQKFLVGKTLIESGANANGRYLKYDDGTMICSHYFAIANVAMTTAYGALYREASSRVWTFPASFYNNPQVFVSGDLYAPFSYPDATLNLTSMSYRLCRVDSGTYNPLVNLLAIGRWK